MNQKTLTGGAILILCFLSLIWGEIEGNERAGRPLSSVMVRRMFSNSAENLKSVLNQAHAYLFAPNLDFRGGGGGSKEKMMEGGGAEEKLKEAIAESMGKTKATVEDSAKSAAKMATNTIQQTKEKVKRSLSPEHDKHSSSTEEL